MQHCSFSNGSLLEEAPQTLKQLNAHLPGRETATDRFAQTLAWDETSTMDLMKPAGGQQVLFILNAQPQLLRRCVETW